MDWERFRNLKYLGKKWNQFRDHLIKGWSIIQVPKMCCKETVSSKDRDKKEITHQTICRWFWEQLKVSEQQRTAGGRRKRTESRHQWHGQRSIQMRLVAPNSGGGCPQGTVSAIGPREIFSLCRRRVILFHARFLSTASGFPPISTFPH